MSPATIERVDRDLRAVELRRAGKTYDEIAVAVGAANRGAAHKMVRRGRTRWVEESTEELRAIELERTEALIARLWPLIDRDPPDFKAFEAFLRLADYRARLAGLYAPTKSLGVLPSTAPHVVSRVLLPPSAHWSTTQSIESSWAAVKPSNDIVPCQIRLTTFLWVCVPLVSCQFVAFVKARATNSGWSHCGQCDAFGTTTTSACGKYPASSWARRGPR
jgi:hypothetical protein